MVLFRDKIAAEFPSGSVFPGARVGSRPLHGFRSRTNTRIQKIEEKVSPIESGKDPHRLIILYCRRFGDMFYVENGPFKMIIVNDLKTIEEMSSMEVFSGRIDFDYETGVSLVLVFVQITT